MTTTLVVGDVHGCSYELKQLLEKIQPDKTILVGDLFTKGPDPGGVWTLIQKHHMLAVKGNHDEWVLQQLNKNPSHQVIKALNQSKGQWLTWLQQLPLFLELEGYIIVHAGLHPSGSLAKTTQAMALNMRRWPEETPESTPWHEQYQGNKGVIFGHDAKQGLVYKEKDGKAFLIGLDSGCVYGNQLSGFIVEQQQIVQVRAKKIYCPIKSPST